MRLLRWLGRKRRKDSDEARAWRDAWLKAVEAPDAAAVARLETALRQRASPTLAKGAKAAELRVADEVELEEEMLDGLRQLVELERELAAARLPRVETSHRIVGADACHFSAPVSLPDDPAQPTGRLLLTSARAAFAGGARVPALPWHAVRHVIQTGRDVTLVRAGAEDGCRFRCNSFGDALCAAAIARYLTRPRRPGDRLV